MKKEEVAQTWKGPKSACKCGHSGDGRLSAHRDGGSVLWPRFLHRARMQLWAVYVEGIL